MYIIYLQDYDDYQRKQTTLLGEGPLPVAQAPSVLPPSVGQVNVHENLSRFLNVKKLSEFMRQEFQPCW